MYEIEATVVETGPTVLKLIADWPVDWLREPGTRTMEIQRELFHGETLDLPSVPTERAEIQRQSRQLAEAADRQPGGR